MLIRIRGAEELLLISNFAQYMDSLVMLTETAFDFLPSVPPKALHTSYQPVYIGH